MGRPFKLDAPHCARPGCDKPARVSLCDFHRDKRRKVLRAQGKCEPVDAARARRHLLRARARGFSWDTLGKRGRMKAFRIRAIAEGETTRITPEQERHILAIEITWQRTSVLIPIVGTLRRMDALAYQGWARWRIAEQIGLSVSPLDHFKYQSVITAVTAAAIAEFFDAHAHVPGPDRKAAQQARRRGALPAAAWEDDDAIDDPDARPLRARQWKRYIEGPVKRIDPEELAGLVEGGRSLELIAEDLGFTVAALRESLTAYRARQRRSQQEKREAA